MVIYGKFLFLIICHHLISRKSRHALCSFVFQIALAAELTEAAQLTNYVLTNGESPDGSSSSTPVLSRGMLSS